MPHLQWKQSPAGKSESAMNTITTRKNLMLASALLMQGLPASLRAAGLDYPFQSTSGQGTAQANAAEAVDATTVFYNPAGMTRLPHEMVSQGAQVLSAHGNFENEGTTDVDNQTVKGGNGGSFLPKLIGGGEFYGVLPAYDGVALGLGVFVPFGANINYKSDWAGRYLLKSVAIESLNFNPSIAYRLGEHHSIGFGVSAEVVHARLRIQADIESASIGLAENAIHRLESSNPQDAAVIKLAEKINSTTGLDFASGVNTLTSSGFSPQAATQIVNALFATTGTGPSAAEQARAQALCASKYRSSASAEYNRCLTAYALARPGEEGGTTGDGSVKAEGYDVAPGWNVGYLYEYDRDTRLGITYRSRIVHRIETDLTWDFSGVTGTVPDLEAATAAQALATRVPVRSYAENYLKPNSRAHMELVNPETVSAAFFRQMNRRLAIMSTVTWARTSLVSQLGLSIDDSERPNGGCYGSSGGSPCRPGVAAQGPASIDTRWRDTFKVSAGMNYRWNESLLLRAGLGYEQTPVPDEQARHAAVPDGDRMIYSLGGRYRFRNDFSIDLAYSFITIRDGKALYTDHCDPAGYRPENYDPDHDGVPTNLNGYNLAECSGNGGTLRGEFKDLYIHAVGLQFNKVL